MNVIIIGGGPVGMFLALNIKDYFRNIYIIEKQKEFTRDQIVVLNSLFLSGSENTNANYWPNKIILELEKHGACYTSNPPLSFDATCYINRGNVLTIPLNILEQVLYSFVKKYKKIKYIRGTNLKLDTQHNIAIFGKNKINYNIVFSAEGPRSMIKDKFKKYYKEKVIVPKNKSYGVVVIFKNPSALVINRKDYPPDLMIRPYLPDPNRYPHARARVFQHQSGIIYLGFAISKEENKKLKSGLTPEFRRTIKDYLELTGINLDFKDLITFETFPICISMVINPVYIYNNVPYILIGDSFFNTHFFTGSGLSSHFNVVRYYTSIFHHGTNILDRLRKTNKEIYNFFPPMVQNVVDSPRFTLDFNKINEKCKKMSIQQLRNLGRKLGLSEKILGLFQKKELCYLVIDHSLKYKLRSGTNTMTLINRELIEKHKKEFI